MWRDLLDYFTDVLRLTRDLSEAREDIKKLNERLGLLSSQVERLSDRINASVELETSKREALILRLQNELMRSDRSLPAARKKPKKKGGKK
jgi:hypothetical protein